MKMEKIINTSYVTYVIGIGMKVNKMMNPSTPQPLIPFNSGGGQAKQAAAIIVEGARRLGLARCEYVDRQ